LGPPRSPVLSPSLHRIEQAKLLKVSKASMENLYPAAKDVVLQTVDSVQGLEFDVVIVNPTVVRSPGFLDANPLNGMFSRARYGLYMVDDRVSWISMNKDDSGPLRKFADQFKDAYRIRWDQDQALSPPIFQEDMLSDNYLDWRHEIQDFTPASREGKGHGIGSRGGIPYLKSFLGGSG